MRNSKLRHYYFNIFLTLGIGLDKFRYLVSTHLQKMSDSGEISFAPLIAALTIEADILNDIIDKKTLDYTGRHTETTGKDESILEFNEYASFLHNVAASKFRNEPAKVEEIFPKGVLYYTDATKAELATKLNYLSTKVIKYATDLTAPVVAEMAQHKLAIETTMSLQQQFKNELGIDTTDYARQRVKICKLLHKDALLITGFHYEEPELVENYFDQSIWATHYHLPNTSIDYNVNPLAIVDTELSFVETTVFEIANNSGFDAGYFSSPIPVSKIPTTYTPFLANTKITVTGLDLKAPTMKYFYLYNPSTTEILLITIKITQ